MIIGGLHAFRDYRYLQEDIAEMPVALLSVRHFDGTGGRSLVSRILSRAIKTGPFAGGSSSQPVMVLPRTALENSKDLYETDYAF